MSALDRPTLDQAEKVIKAAEDELSALCHGKRFNMTIPVQDDDPDIIIGNALYIARELLKAKNETALIDHEIKLSMHKHHSLKDIVEELRLLADSMSTHEALADKIGISYPTLSRILTGNTLPGRKVCAFLKIEPVLVYKDLKE